MRDNKMASAKSLCLAACVLNWTSGEAIWH